MDGMVTIKIDTFVELVRSSEKLRTVERFVNSGRYYSKDDIFAILEIKEIPSADQSNLGIEE